MRGHLGLRPEAEHPGGEPASVVSHVFPGAGGDTRLGLAICKGDVEAHGGRILAEYEGLGTWAGFTFTLPTEDGAVTGRAPGCRPMETGRRENRRGSGCAFWRWTTSRSRCAASATPWPGPDMAPWLLGIPKGALRLMAEERPQLVLLELSVLY